MSTPVITMIAPMIRSVMGLRDSPAEKQAIRRAKVRAFVLAAQGNLRAEMLAKIFLTALPKVRAIVAKHRPPFIAKIWRDGKVGLLET